MPTLPDQGRPVNIAFAPEAWAWKNSPYKGTQKLIHLTMARLANEAHQWRLWMGDQFLADMAGCEARTVRRAKVQMIEDGYLEEFGFDSETGNKQYLFLVPGIDLSGTADNLSGVAAQTGHLSQQTGHLRQADRTSTTSAPITNERERKDKDTPVVPPSSPSLELVAPTPNLQRIAAMEFSTFWEIYPTKKGKIAAQRAFTRATRSVDPDAVIAGARRYRDDPNRDPQYTKHPATWLNGGCWDDEPEPDRRPRDPTRRGGPSLVQLRDAAYASQQPAIGGPR